MRVNLSLNWKPFQFNVVLFLFEFKIISARVSVADCSAPSYRSCFVAVTVFTTSSVFTFHYRRASTELFGRCASIQKYKIISLAERYSQRLTLQCVCYCIQNYFSHWASHFELFPSYFSCWSLRCELFCHWTAIQHYFCCWSPRSELLFCWFISLADSYTGSNELPSHG